MFTVHIFSQLKEIVTNFMNFYCSKNLWSLTWKEICPWENINPSKIGWKIILFIQNISRKSSFNRIISELCPWQDVTLSKPWIVDVESVYQCNAIYVNVTSLKPFMYILCTIKIQIFLTIDFGSVNAWI